MATKGLNRAKLNKSIYFSEHAANSKKRCIFLSHASKDKVAVRKIGDYIMKAGVDIYLDENDSDLQAAIESSDNHNAVTQCIENGLSASTDILCIVSEETKRSWWVPYEVGYGKKSNAQIATLLLNDVKDIPSYLYVSKLLKDIRELNNFLDSLEKSIQHNEAFSYKYAETGILQASYTHPLSDIVKPTRF
ncbi:toll/interleukin-1 receptor domain-containing protein (plasmid) [Niallia taxi]|uniref:toll/interleukin-1 receptor domain-containing protein n=1 Tax=Niallia TaxID=2837506 RepID=UPI0015F390CF|nr:toll/interleukin-1 receptor domain-containing protein [Niallia taxi]MED4057183.1 toll/interleukin-1 receptor domain-containing protein [Niallia taxi]MED4122129.1 toll/interleukin-1 receptor domain-containing protein [Niallia taxi]